MYAMEPARRLSARFRRVSTLLALAGSALVALPSGDLVAQDAAAAARARAMLPPESGRGFDQILAEAAAQGLPTDPLVNRALYGLARNIAAERVLDVLRQDLQYLRSARELLGGLPFTGADLESVADALRQGVPEHALRNVAGTPRAEASVAMAVRTLSDLLAIGVPVDRGMDLLEVSRGRPAAELLDLPAAVDRLIRQGMVPGAAAEAVGATLTERGTRPTSGTRPRG